MKKKLLAVLMTGIMAMSFAATTTAVYAAKGDDDNTLTVNVARLRKKLENVGMEGRIKTKKGIGYYLDK